MPMHGERSRRMLKKFVQQGRANYHIKRGGWMIPTARIGRAPFIVRVLRALGSSQLPRPTFFSILLIRHFVVIQPNMVSKFMNHRVTNLLNDFGLGPAETQDGTSIDRDTGGELTGGVKKRCLIDWNALIQAQQVVF